MLLRSVIRNDLEIPVKVLGYEVTKFVFV